MAEILTNNAMFSSFMIVLIVFALGDIVGKITKGKLSGMMVVMLLFLVGFLTKLIPADIIDQGGLTALSKLAIAMVLFNMGTTLNVKQLIEEWRTVLMAALCMLASCLVMFLVSPIIGFDTMLVGYQRCGNGNFADGKRRSRKRTGNGGSTLCSHLFRTEIRRCADRICHGYPLRKKTAESIPRESGAV